VTALLAASAWGTALGLMSWLMDGHCVTGSRTTLWMSALVSVALAAAPVGLLWRWRQSLNADSEAEAGTRLVLDLAVAGSVVMALVIFAAGVPIVFLDACRA
jgi:hypothetical protein